MDAHRFVVLHALAHEVQLAQHILCILISVLRRAVKPFCCCGEILRYIFPSVVLLTQTVGSIAVSTLCSGFQPAHPLLRVTHLYIIGEQQFSEGVLRIAVSLLCRLLKPAPGIS